MKRFASAMLVASVTMLSAAASAQQPLAELPGFFPGEHLDLVSPDDASVEINLQGSMLRLISALAGDEDPQFAQLVSALDAIRVRSGQFAEADSAAVRERLSAGLAWLDDRGWLAMVRVREPDEEIYIYSREHDGDLVGFIVLALESGEATAVNLVGRIDPTQLVRLVEGLDIDVLDGVELPPVHPSGDQP
jgi:hypothetical protein